MVDTMGPLEAMIAERERTEGRTEGLIEGAIRVYKKIGSPADIARKAITEDYHLTEAEAERYVKQYY